MSLVGNLEDLSLGDIMQIISLSKKSGVLALKGEEGSGRIMFRAGLVHAACLEGRPDDLRALLVASGAIDAAAFDAFAAHAEKTGMAVAELVVQKSDLTAENVDALVRESVESSILEMFSWQAGDFSFDVRNQLDATDPQVVLSAGVNAQYLAMEGMRICDERNREDVAEAADPNAVTEPAHDSAIDDPIFGDDSLEVDPAHQDGDEAVLLTSTEIDEDLSAADILVGTVVSNEQIELEAETATEPNLTVVPAVEVDGAVNATPVGSQVGQSPPKALLVSPRPLVLIDSDVVVLEWAKTALQGDFSRIHSFQQAEQGLARIRQYLIRGEFPVVLISTGIRIDPLSGIHGLADFVSRLKTQASKLIVIGLQGPEGQGAGADGPTPPAAAFDRIVSRPTSREIGALRSEENPTESDVLARSIRETLEAKNDSSRSGSVGEPASDASLIRNLRDATTKLQDASSRGEILPVVLDFASEIFSRVAILIVRDEQVFAIAGRGIEALEVDPLDSSPPVPSASIGSWLGLRGDGFG